MDVWHQDDVAVPTGQRCAAGCDENGLEVPRVRSDAKPATIGGDEITFAEPDGRQEFLELVQDEASYDRACGARTVGATLARKIADAIA